MSKKSFILLIISWIIIISASFMYNYFSINKNAENLVRETLKAFFYEVVTTRSWNAGHTGVYVPITDQSLPNPYLKDSLRELTTVEGIQLTKINPAYMTRQISEIAAENNAIKYHITSKLPIRPANEANEWEIKALDFFESGAKEYFSLSEDGSQFHYMAPLYVKESCLTCHAEQGYKIGDIRGGISVNTSSEQYMGLIKAEIVKISSFHFVFFMLGFIGLILFRKHSIKNYNIIISKNNKLAVEIDERIKAENTVKQLNMGLEDIIQQRTTELEEAKKQLYESLQKEKELSALRSRIINTISHEYNTPLTIISSSAELIRRKLEYGQTGHIDKHFDNIMKSVRNLDDLIKDMMTYKVINEGVADIKYEEVNLTGILTDVVTEADEHDNEYHNIKISGWKENINIITDKKYLKLVFSNLLINALKYSEEKTTIDIKVEKSDDSVSISFIDEGIGIRKEDIENIFDPFIKSRELIGLYPGTGLGLAMNKKMVENLGGEIICSSEYKKGSTFTVKFPIKK